MSSIREAAERIAEAVERLGTGDPNQPGVLGDEDGHGVALVHPYFPLGATAAINADGSFGVHRWFMRGEYSWPELVAGFADADQLISYLDGIGSTESLREQRITNAELYETFPLPLGPMAGGDGRIAQTIVTVERDSRRVALIVEWGHDGEVVDSAEYPGFFAPNPMLLLGEIDRPAFAGISAGIEKSAGRRTRWAWQVPSPSTLQQLTMRTNKRSHAEVVVGIAQRVGRPAVIERQVGDEFVVAYLGVLAPPWISEIASQTIPANAQRAA
jgi:hypothetical protein